jgi:GNAT superfamily N-acetyltransferase
VTDEQRGLRREQIVALAPFTAADAERLAELDRSESVPMLYTVRRGEIVPLGRGEEIPQWSGAWLEAVADFARRQLESGGTGVGAYDGARDGRLAGIAVLGGAAIGARAVATPGDEPETLQLALVYVGRQYRRHGLAGRLMDEMRREAARRGARRLYISATPSEGALRFYLGQGARLADPPDHELFALEPEDVHLVLDL